jgi:gas vesicle protein
MNDRILGLWFGLGVGIGLGILLAPKSGRETRSLIRGKAADGVEYLKQKSTETRDKASDLIREGAETVVQQGEAIKTAVQAAKQTYKEAGTS